MKYTLPILLTIQYVTSAVTVKEAFVQNNKLSAKLQTRAGIYDLNTSVSHNWKEMAARHQRYHWLLNDVTLDDETAIVLAIVAFRAVDDVQMALIKNDSLVFMTRGNQKTVPFDNRGLTNEELHQRLSAYQSVSEGYVIKELIGRSIQVYTPSERVRTTTEHSCSCSQWEQGQRDGSKLVCDHIAMVREYVKDRSRWQKVGAAILT